MESYKEKYMESIYRRNTWSPYTAEIHGVYIQEKYMESIYRRNTWSSYKAEEIQGVDEEVKVILSVYKRNIWSSNTGGINREKHGEWRPYIGEIQGEQRGEII